MATCLRVHCLQGTSISVWRAHALAHRCHWACRAKFQQIPIGTLLKTLQRRRLQFSKSSSWQIVITASLPSEFKSLEQPRVLVAAQSPKPLVKELQQGVSVRDILVLCRNQADADHVTGTFGKASVLGNEAAVRAWTGGIESLPAYQGPFDAIYISLPHEELQRSLRAAVLLMKPGSYVILCAAQGSSRNVLTGDEVAALTQDVPLRHVSEQAGKFVLQVPAGYALEGAPLLLEADVVRGFGRGSRQLGFPTANMDPVPLQPALAGRPFGVYFGWAQVGGGGVHKMAMNVGRRPTIERGDTGAALTVELHLLAAFPSDFYGQRMRAAVVGYLRPETQFAGIQQLIARIRADVGIARSQLDLPQHAAVQAHPFFAPADVRNV